MQIPIHATDHAYYVAFRIERILMVNALGEYRQLYATAPEYLSGVTIMQHTELVGNLLQSGDERFTYEMRITSHPNSTVPNQGYIDVHCIIAIRSEAQAEAHEYALRIYRLFNAHFRDVVWVVVADVAALLADNGARHAVSLLRKSGFIVSDRAESPHTYGFVARPMTPARSQQATTDRMFFMSAFVASGRQSHALFEYMLQHPHSVTVSIRLQRTQLSAAELHFCQTNLDTYSDMQKYPAAVTNQLAQYQQLMNGMLVRSYALAALLNIDIVSPQFIPEQLISLVGNLITQPAGGVDMQQQLQYAGGYDIVHHSDYLPVVNALAQVSMRPIDKSLKPEIDRLPHIVDVNEAAVAFHIPRSSLTPIPGMQMQSHRQLRPPSDLSDTGTVIGQYNEHGITKPIHISEIDRTRHAYIIGQTGTGKSTVLKSMVLDDIAKGRGVCVIDPHGDLINDVLAQIPVERRDDVIVVDPTQSDYPVGINVLEYKTPEERETVLMLFFSMMKQLQRDKGEQHARWTSPGWERYTRNNSYWVTQDINDPGTVIEFHQMMENSEYYKRWLPIDKSDSKLVSWQNELEAIVNMHKTNESHSLSTSVNSQFDDFIYDTRLRLIFGQKKSTIDFFSAMNTKKIIMVNLSRGLLSETASAFLGYIIITKLQQAALKRAELPAQQRTVFSIYVDEFQNYTTESFVSLLSESRKYGIALTLANQFLAQIENKRIISAILGNVGTIIAFRVGIKDGEELVPRFAPEVTPNDLINLPNWQAYVSTQVHGQSRRPFSMQTIRPREELDLRVQAAVIAQSKHRYGRLRSEVERTIAKSMQLNRDELLEPQLRVPLDKLTTSTETMALTPVPHETIVTTNPTSHTTATHGCGLSLWNRQTKKPVYSPIIIGLHPHQYAAIVDVPLTDILPYQQQLGAHYHQFQLWVDVHGITTLRAAAALLDYQKYIGESHAHIDNYYSALLAYQMHQSRHDVPWCDIALAGDMAGALDAQQCAWIWHNQRPAFATQIHDVRAIAASKQHLFVLHNNGTVQCFTPTAASIIADLTGIVHIQCGENFGVAIDATGHAHMVYADEESRQRFDMDPSPVAIQLVACGFDHVIACTTDNQFVSWGKNDQNCGVAPSELATQQIVALAAGYDRSFALDTNGRLYAWGKHELTSETMQTLNAHTVQYIACARKSFLCCTADGTWWHNNQPLTFPLGVDARYITRIVGNYADDWMVIRRVDPLAALLQFGVQAIDTVSALDRHITTALRDAGLLTVFAVLEKTDTELSAMPYFHIHAAQLTVLVDYLQAQLAALSVPHHWPTHPLYATWFGWYVSQFVPSPTPTESHQKRDDDDLRFDDDFFSNL